MQFSDVYEEYLKCAFCGVNIDVRIAYTPADEDAVYHDRDCHALSRSYPDLVRRLSSSPAEREGGR